MENLELNKLIQEVAKYQIDVKLKLLGLAKDMVRDNVVPHDTNVKELYLELREEVLGIKVEQEKEN